MIAQPGPHQVLLGVACMFIATCRGTPVASNSTDGGGSKAKGRAADFPLMGGAGTIAVPAMHGLALLPSKRQWKYLLVNLMYGLHIQHSSMLPAFRDASWEGLGVVCR
jgi:hypothetical protein